MKRHTNKALVSLALLVSMLFSLLPNLPQATATDLTAAPQEAAVLPEKSPVYQLDASCKLLSYVDEAVFAESNHIARLPSEETLSTYAFLNSDGTKTVYYMNEAVKFLDSDGNVVEKDIALTAATDGYTTTRNNISLSIPTDPAKGIRLTYEGKYITLTPQGGTFRTATQATDSSVTYPNFYGAGTSLVYTPTLSGVKEDIVLQSYTGVNSFTFTLNTNGLNMYQSNGRYFLAESKVSTRRYELGDVVAFDARGRFSVGTMTVTTVMPGQAYRITVTMDEDFLADSGTVYPLSVDSSITVSDESHGAGAIEDTTIYSGTPTTNGNWPYMHCGYYNSTYKKARSLFRLTGLTSDSIYQSMSANDIVSATFHIREATGSAGLDIDLYANDGSAAWTESGATWSNAGVVLGQIVDTVSAVGNKFAVFDMTDLVKDWKINPQNAAKGFVLKSTNETTLDKAFCSSEHGTASYRPYVTVTYNDSTAPVVPDGVYRIISKSANKPIGAAQSIANGTTVATQNTYTESALEMFQLWKITHLANGLYSVRPLHKLDMGLEITNSAITICQTMADNILVGMPDATRWLIQDTNNGYSFMKNGNENLAMMASTSGTTVGINIATGTYTANSAQFHFELSPVDDVQGALFLFGIRSNTYISSMSSTSPTVSISPGSQRSLEQIGFVLSVCDANDIGQTVHWSSSNPSVAIVNSNTGTITPLSLGETTIRAERTIEDTHHIVEYTLAVSILEGSYFIRNKASDKYIDIGNHVISSNAQIEQQEFYGGDTQRWIFTNLGDNTYTIHSANSETNYYLSIVDDTSYIGQAIVLKTGPVNDSMKWKITITESGAFKLMPLTGELSDYVLAASPGITDALLQQLYSNDTEFEDEWLFHLESDYSLMYIGAEDGDAFMPLIATRVESAFLNNTLMNGYTNTSMNKAQALEHISSSKIFSCITHGLSDGIFLSNNIKLTTANINALDDSAFDDLVLAYLGACLTAEGKEGANNFANALYNKGADTVVGFAVSIDVPETNYWTEVFMTHLAKGMTIEEACQIADNKTLEEFESSVGAQELRDQRYIVGPDDVVPCS